MPVKIIVEKYKDGYAAYATELKGVVVGEGDTPEEAIADVQSAIKFHLETFGEENILMSCGNHAGPDDELTEEDKKDIEEAVADIKADRVYTAEEVYRELGLTGKSKTLADILAECGDDEEEKNLIRRIETDPAVEEGFRRAKLIKGNVVEIQKVDNKTS